MNVSETGIGGEIVFPVVCGGSSRQSERQNFISGSGQHNDDDQHGKEVYASDKCFLFDGFTWIKYTKMKMRRFGMKIVKIHNNFLVSGGSNYDTNPSHSLTSTETILPDLRSSQLMGPLTNSRVYPSLPEEMKYHCTLNILSNHFIFFANGRRTFAYDMVRQIWLNLPDLHFEHVSPVCGVYKEEYIIVSGGLDQNATEIMEISELLSLPYDNSIENYETSHNLSWKLTDPSCYLPKRLAFSQSVQTRDTFLVVGGRSNGNYDENVQTRMLSPFNDVVYMFTTDTSSSESKVNALRKRCAWRKLFQHVDTARAKFSVVPIHRSFNLCSPSVEGRINSVALHIDGNNTLPTVSHVLKSVKQQRVSMTCHVRLNDLTTAGDVAESMSVTFFHNKNNITQSMETLERSTTYPQTLIARTSILYSDDLASPTFGIFHCSVCLSHNRRECYKSNYVHLHVKSEELTCQHGERPHIIEYFTDKVKVRCALENNARADQYLWTIGPTLSQIGERGGHDDINGDKNAKKDISEKTQFWYNLNTTIEKDVVELSSAFSRRRRRQHKQPQVVICNAFTSSSRSNWMKNPCVFHLMPGEELVGVLIVGGSHPGSRMSVKTSIYTMQPNTVCPKVSQFPYSNINHATGAVLTKRRDGESRQIVICGGLRLDQQWSDYPSSISPSKQNGDYIEEEEEAVRGDRYGTLRGDSRYSYSEEVESSSRLCHELVSVDKSVGNSPSRDQLQTDESDTDNLLVWKR